MRLADILQAGGPGSGCRGPNCGRPPGGVSRIPRSQFPLSKTQQGMESRFRFQVGKDPEAAKAEYKRRFGNILNADNAKELSAEYEHNKSAGAPAVHETASWLVKQMFAEELAKNAPPGKDNTVVFTAGGAGAGKTTAVSSLPGVQAIQDRAQIVYDGTLRPSIKAVQRIDQALAAGKHVEIAYVHRDPESSFRQGVLGRASRQEEQTGSGRTVPLDEFAHQHSSIQDSMRQVAEKYANDPRVKLSVIDNSRGKGKTELSTLDALPKNSSFADLKPWLQKILEDEHNAGRISDTIYRATKGHGGDKGEVGM